MYSTVILERHYHSLFFPGGTRSRSGSIESKLKLGLLGTGITAYINNLLKNKKNPDIFVIPATINYHIVLEAETLIDDYLKETGKSKYIIGKDESSSFYKVIQFLFKMARMDTSLHIKFGQAFDLFGNKVDENGKLIWAKKSKYGLTIYYSTCASLTTDGGFVVTGETVSPNVALLNFDVGNTDIFVAKFDKDGNLGGNCESSSNFRTILKDYSPIISSVEFIQMSFIPFHTMQHLKLSRFLHSLQKYGMLR